jgi:hypothetical protein
VEALTDTELFRTLAALGWIDRVALAIVVVAALRGLWIGLLREAFSIAALAAAFVAVKLWTDPATAWLLEHSPFDSSLSDRQAHIVGGLGLIDRLLGGVLGGAEGALVVSVALVGVVAFVGRDHEVLAGSRSIELLSRARLFADELPNVASPPPESEPEDDESAPPDDAPREIDFELGSGDEVSV